MNQAERGKAFEYALATKLSETLPHAQLLQSTVIVARRCFDRCNDQESMSRAAREAAHFLPAFDAKLEQTTSIRIQADKEGQKGDVRDIVLGIPGQNDVGISAKTHHHALKHSRLSYKIDFGSMWADFPVSRAYWQATAPIFNQMKEMKSRGVLFREVPDKQARFYLPILVAFEDEFGRLCESFGHQFISRVFRYLIGRHDFYKVIKERRFVLVQSFNLHGTLGWGQRWTIPNAIEQIRRPPGSSNTLLVNFTGGWQISFRLHNARSQVEPSLKFDIKFVGVPVYAAGNQIPYS